jgi:methylated-DNA-[protein]-cysteine S-methyltransferase
VTYYTTTDTPVGPMVLTAEGDALSGSYLHEGRHNPELSRDRERRDHHPVLEEAVAQLDDYFGGRRSDFDLPLQMDGTPFQRQVWSALRTIPYGETASYGEIAAQVGQPGAARAVGSANGRNPVAVIVPCHRVIAADGTLGGYGGGLPRKRWLLALEGAWPSELA